MAMQDNREIRKQEYRSIAKGTAMMGGVQLFNILINLVRGKLVALFLGPAGMGVMSLLTSATNTIQQFSGLGLHMAIVKEVAGAEIPAERFRIIAIVRKLLLLTALLGLILTVVLSYPLSQWSFGDSSYTLSFVLLSVMVFFTTLSNGEASILQGAHTIKRLAYSSLVGSSVGLFVGVPLYYFYGRAGIVPAMIALSLATFAFYRYHTYKEFGIVGARPSLRENKPLVRSMVLLGFVLMVATLIGTFTTYGINAFIRYQGALQDVGLYQAANSITNQYVGVVFSAMSVDFFPRLAAVATDNDKVCRAVNSQAEIVLLVVAPLVMLMILLTPMLIRILLTDEFLVLGPVVRIMAIGIFLKAISYAMGYIAFAKGDKRTFFWLDGVGGNTTSLVLSLLLYSLWGLMGLGIAMLLVEFTFVILHLVVTHRLYAFRMQPSVIRLIAILGAAIVGCYCASLIEAPLLSFAIMTLLCVLTGWFSLRELNQRMDVVQLIRSKLNRRKS